MCLVVCPKPPRLPPPLNEALFLALECRTEICEKNVDMALPPQSLHTRNRGLVAARAHLVPGGMARPCLRRRASFLSAPWHAKTLVVLPFHSPSSAPSNISSGAPTTGDTALQTSSPAANSVSATCLPSSCVLCHHHHNPRPEPMVPNGDFSWRVLASFIQFLLLSPSLPPCQPSPSR